MTLFQSSLTEQLYRTKTGEVVLHQIPSYEYDSTPIEFSTFIGSRLKSNRETFVRTYADFLGEAIAARPELYQFATAEGYSAQVYAEKMADAISFERSTLEGQALITTLKSLKLPKRHKALAKWINEVSLERCLEIIIQTANDHYLNQSEEKRSFVIRESYIKISGDKNA